jgi:hypothetical protein
LRYASSYLGETGVSDLQIWNVDKGAFLQVQYSDGVEFWLDREVTTVWAQWPTASSLEDTQSYLVGPILGLLLRLRGIVCLHASAVNISDRAVVFVGPEGAGKSTTAAAFARRGYKALSDDIVALVNCGDHFEMLPAYPRLNLWPDSVKLLYGSSDALPLIMPHWEKRRLDLEVGEGTKFEKRLLRLGVIYVLGTNVGGLKKRIELISQKEALMTLVENTYATNFLDAKQRAEEFQVLSRLVSTVPVLRLHRGKEAEGVEEFCTAIRQNYADIVAPSTK